MARLTGLAALLALLFGSAVMGEPPAGTKDGKKPSEEKKPSQLEELIAQALQGNPDVRVAEAKMREAEAELNRTRLQAIQKVVAHQHNIETLEGAVKTAEARLRVAEANVQLGGAERDRVAEIIKKGVVPKSELDAAQAKLAQAHADREAARADLQAAKAALAKAQSELPYLLGKATKDDRQVHMLDELYDLADRQSVARRIYLRDLAAAKDAWKAAGLALPQGTVAEKLRQALDAPVSLKFEGLSLGSVLKEMAAHGGVAIVPASGLPSDLYDKAVTLNVNDLPRGACFQLLEDLTGVQFGVREYGIVVTDKLPPGVMPLHDFWKGGDKPKATDKK
jgi:outer membrane protein TolC